MLINLLMAACMYPTLLIVFVVLKNEVKSAVKRPGKAMTLFGVALSHGQMADPEVDEIMERFNREMNHMFIIIAVFPVCAFFVPWFSISFTIWMMWILVLLILIFVPIVRGNKRVKELKSRRGWYDSDDSSDVQENHWYLGMFYYNPEDHHTMTQKNAGIGSTVNFARPAGKAVGIFSAVALLSIPVICVWVIMQEFVPIHLTIKNDTLIASQMIDNYTIPINQIEDLQLLEEPPRCSKINGTSIDTLKKGTFENHSGGRFELFLNPTNNAFITFRAAGTLYYLSGQTDTETQAIYNNLKAQNAP